MKLFKFVIVCISAFFLTSCDQGLQRREYMEHIVTPQGGEADQSRGLSAPFSGGRSDDRMDTSDPQVKAMIDSSAVAVNLGWDVPEGWRETRETGMRLVTFNSLKPYEILCTIIALGGDAGGLAANVKRWMRQINLPPMDDRALNQFLQKQSSVESKGGLVIRMIDLTSLNPMAGPDAGSMMGAITQINGKTIFIKMTGTRQAVTQQAQNFYRLCQSLDISNE